MNKVIVFEEQEGDYKVQFEDTPDLGMAVDIQWLITQSSPSPWALFFCIKKEKEKKKESYKCLLH